MEQNGGQHCDIASTLPYTSEAPLVKRSEGRWGYSYLFPLLLGSYEWVGKGINRADFPCWKDSSFTFNWGKELKPGSIPAWKCIITPLPHPISWSEPRYRTVSVISEDKTSPGKLTVCTPPERNLPPLSHMAPSHLLFFPITEKWVKYEIPRLKPSVRGENMIH